MKTELGIRHVTPEIVDQTINKFWNEAMKLGPDQIAVLDGIEFKSLIAASKEWPSVMEGIKLEILRTMPADAEVLAYWTSTPMMAIAGAIHMSLRLGILIGLETAADDAAKH